MKLTIEYKKDKGHMILSGWIDQTDELMSCAVRCDSKEKAMNFFQEVLDIKIPLDNKE